MHIHIAGAGTIGEALVHHFQAEGHRVSVFDRADEAIRQVADGDLVRTLDALNWEAVEEFIRHAATALGPISAAFFTIGVSPAVQGRRPRVEEMTPAEFQEVVRINLVSAYAWARALSPRLAPGASVVMLGSFSARAPQLTPASAAYVASKSGLHGLVQALALEWAPRGIRVNALAPGRLTSPLREGITDPTTEETILQQIPLGRLATPEDVIAAADYLIRARYVTGTILDINGGRWMH